MLVKNEETIQEQILELKAFEQEVAEIFNRGEIKAPVHLAGGNERQLLNTFKHIKSQDWVLSQWRSHYHCLLKGVPKDQLMFDIRAGRSIALCYPEQRVLCSAIVGGVLPIALGIAWSIKRSGKDEQVWVFVGDMTAATGMFSECSRYAWGHQLPVSFVIEDNGKSVCTPTDKVWNGQQLSPVAQLFHRYKYDLPWPHQGTGKRVQF
jgi:pyruvate dehydrogenase E1 component alpha subunit